MATTVVTEKATSFAGAPQVTHESPEDSLGEKNKWLVLIGVSFYMVGSYRGDVQPEYLAGPPNDLEEMRRFFHDKVKIDNDHTFILKSTTDMLDVNYDHTKTPTNKPVEQNEAEWPTYENIITTLYHVLDVANPGDLVYVYYAGHGGQALTIFQEVKGHRGVDECLVPLDITCGGRYVRDVEIGAIVHKMITKKDLHVTLMFDSCHSGGMNRSASRNELVARGLGKVDPLVLTTDKSDVPTKDIESALEAGALTPTHSGGSSWLRPQGYSLLSACLPSQGAWEDGFNEIPRGAFTYWLIDALERAAEQNMLDKLTHNELHRRVLANVRDWAKKKKRCQDPVLMGGTQRLFLSSTSTTRFVTVPVLAVSQVEVRLGVGMIHGASRQDVYEIYDWNEGKNELVHPKATVQLSDVFATESSARFKRKPKNVQLGDQAVLLHKHIDTSTHVKLVCPENTTQSTSQNINRLWTMLNGKYQKCVGPLTLVEDTNDVSHLFHIKIHETEGFELLDRERQAIPRLPIFNTPESVLGIASKLGRHVQLRDLNNSPPGNSGNLFRLSFSPKGSDHFFDVSKNVHIFPENGKYEITFTNTSFEPLYLVILEFRPLWGILQVYPRDGDFEEVRFPDNQKVIPFENVMSTDLPNATHNVSKLKVFISNRPISLRSLEELDVYPQGADEDYGSNEESETENTSDNQALKVLSGHSPAVPEAIARGDETASRDQVALVHGSETTVWYTRDFTICTVPRTNALALPDDFFLL